MDVIGTAHSRHNAKLNCQAVLARGLRTQDA